MDLDTFLKLLTTGLALVGLAFPVVGGWALWKLSKRFATRGALRGAVKRMSQEFNQRVMQVERDLANAIQTMEKQQEERHQQQLRAIQGVNDAVCKDINGVGDKLTAVAKIAELALNRADAADDKVSITANDLKHINEHGTAASAVLRKQVEALGAHLTTLNQLLPRHEQHQRKGGMP